MHFYHRDYLPLQNKLNNYKQGPFQQRIKIEDGQGEVPLFSSELARPLVSQTPVKDVAMPTPQFVDENGSHIDRGSRTQTLETFIHSRFCSFRFSSESI